MKDSKKPRTSSSIGPQKSRRAFIKHSAALTAVAATGTFAGLSPLDIFAGNRQPASKMMHGIQVGAVSFVDEGVDKVLDILQQRGAINTLFLTTFTHGRGLGGRQIPKQPFPNHDSQQSNKKTFHGNNYAIPHPQFYKNTVLKETRATEHGNFDILASV